MIHELARRDFAAYSTDELEGLTRLEHRDTGEPANWPEGMMDFTQYAWNWQEQPLKQLLGSHPLVFVGASVSNQRELAHLFDKIFLLTIDPATLRHRLTTRTTNTYGKNPKDLERVLRVHSSVEQEWLDQGAIPIDATRSLDAVVTDILEHIAA